jgi:hypothetical protein
MLRCQTCWNSTKFPASSIPCGKLQFPAREEGDSQLEHTCSGRDAGQGAAAVERLGQNRCDRGGTRWWVEPWHRGWEARRV